MASTLDEALCQAPTQGAGFAALGDVMENPAVREALDARVDYSVWGMPRTINAIAHPLPFLGAAPQKGAGALVAQRFFSQFGSDFPVLDWGHIEFRQISQDVGPLGWTVYRVSQVIDGVPVRNSDMLLHVDQNGALRYFHGNFYSDVFAEPLDYVMDYEEALAKAQANLLDGEVFRGMELEYVDTTISGIGPQALKPMWLVYSSGRILQLDGVTGLLVNEEQMDAFALQTSLKWLSHRKELPGTTMYDSTLSGYLGQIYNKFGTWGWTSYDNADSPMVLYYNYCFCDGVNDNCANAAGSCDCTTDPGPGICAGLKEEEPQLAFWYGGADAINFNSQQVALNYGSNPAGAVVGFGNGKLDILAHEFGHGFNQNSAELVYEYESGALAEGFADCFAAMVDTANWTLFESSGFTTFYGNSVALSLSDPHQTDLVAPGYLPGSASCEAAFAHFGHQPDQYLEKSTALKASDFGGVHEDSGIIGKACWLLGNTSSNTFYGVTVAGQGRTATAYVFHYAQRQFLTSTSKFIDARLALLTTALLYDYAQNDPNYTMTAQTTNAMDAVGIWSSNGNIGGTLKNTTQRLVAAVEQVVGTSYNRFIFFRNASNIRLKYLKYVPGTGWSKLDLPSPKYMADISPTGVETQIWDLAETSVFYQTSSNVLTRAVVRQGTVAQPVASENLQITTSSQVGGAKAGVDDGAYGIAYRQDTDSKVHIKYLLHTNGDIDEALLPYGDYQVKVLQTYPFPAIDLVAFGGLSMTRGDGKVWLAYQKLLMVNGVARPGDICVTYIAESTFAWDYQYTRYWARPTCFAPPGCNGSLGHPTETTAGPAGDPVIFAYSPSTSSSTRYYLAYPVDDVRTFGGDDRTPVVMTFTWNNGIVGPTRPVLVDKGISFDYPVVGGFLKDTLGNLRMYYSDTTSYISELMKHGY